MENYFKKKTSGKFCTKMPKVPAGKEIRPECNFSIFARKLVDGIFRGLRNNWKILSTMKKKTRVTFLRKCPFVRQVQNFDQNAMLAFLHRNL